MSTKPQGPAVRVTAVNHDPLAQFSAELAERFPRRVIQRFIMPKAVRECREVFIIEISSREELDAAIFTESIVTPAERSSAKLMAEAERREVIRISIVGLGELHNGAIAYRHTNVNAAVPFAEISDWPSKAWVALHRFYGEVNGVPTAELDEGTKGAQIVGAFYAPKTATPDGADTGRSADSTGANT